MPDLTRRAQELLDSIEDPTFQDMVEEVRASLPLIKKMLAKYMKHNQGYF